MKINYFFNKITLKNLNLNLKIWTTIYFERIFLKKGNHITLTYKKKKS